MTTRTLNNTQVAIGLKWLEPGAISIKSRPSKTYRRLLAENPTPVGYVAIETRDGTQPGITTFLSDVGLPSAASWLAAAQTSAVLIESLEENLIWLCVIEQGVVFPSGDLIGNRDVIETRLEELMYDISGSDMPFYDKTGIFKELVDAQALSFSDLVESTETNQTNICHLIQHRNLKKPIQSTAALVMLLFIAYGGWTSYKRLKDDASAQEPQLTQSRIATERQKEITRLEDYLAQDAGALIAFFADNVYDRPLRAGGWRTVSYQWRNGGVEVIWERDIGNIAAIAQYLIDRNWSMDESSGIITEKFDFAAPRLELKPINLILGNQQDRFELLDLLARTPGRWTLGASTETGSNFKARKSQLQGTSVHLASALAAASNLRHQPIHINFLEAKVGKHLSWTIEGEYFEKAR